MNHLELRSRLGPLRLACPAVMGILNTTPDSFSDSGRFVGRSRALAHAEHLAAAGAAIIDIGGESTRPGARGVDEQQEIDRVVPVVEAMRAALDVPISVDTSKPAVMRAAVNAGARMINDVRALREPGALEAAVELGVPVCLMHMQGEPRTMQREPRYANVVAEVTEFLRERVTQCVQAGMDVGQLLIDPGFGFGKRPGDNIELLANLRQLLQIGPPILIGVSRKTTLGELTGREVHERLPASLAAAVMAVNAGASIVRAHDVAETVDALKVVRSILEVG